MKLYNVKAENVASPSVVLDDMILTKNLPTTAGSKMLNGYMSLFDAEVVTKLSVAGYAIAGKAAVGEFAFDLMGESASDGACVRDGKLCSAAHEIVLSGESEAAVMLDVNGSVRRASAQSGLVSIKPTYGTVSRFGTVPVACSGECVSVVAKSAAKCAEILSVISGHDAKDGTSLSALQCKDALKGTSSAPKTVCVVEEMLQGIDGDVQEKIDAACAAFEKAGATVEKISVPELPAARSAWNILFSAELCNNVSRYDGVKYGYRSENFSGIDELYTNSRTEAFGKLLKTAIIYGSETLSTENYQKVYDKALRIRRVIVEKFAELFAKYDTVILPAVSKMAYTEEMIAEKPDLCYVENLYTAPASIAGLPSVVCGGVALVCAPLTDGKLLSYAKIITGEEN